MTRRAVLVCLCLLCPVPLWAQSVQGVFTWVQSRPTDLSSYKLTVDAAAPVSIGLPTTNSVPLALTVGAHTLYLSACYTDATCVLSTAYPVVVSAAVGSAISYTLLAPADNATITAGTPTQFSVNATDNSGILSVTLQYFNGTWTNFTCTHVGDVYSRFTTPTITGTGRLFQFVIRAKDGEIVTTTQRHFSVVP